MKKKIICLLSFYVVAGIHLAGNSVLANEKAALSAQAQAEFDDLTQKAVGKYSARQYEEAIALFEKAYAIQAEPELLYNIARSYERLARTDEAIEVYQKFLDTPGSTGDLRVRALNNLAALQEERAAREKISGTGADSGADGSTDAGVEEKMEPEQESMDATDTSQMTESEPTLILQDRIFNRKQKILKTLGWTFLGVGIAGMGTGSVFGVLALKSKKKYDDMDGDIKKLDYRDDMDRNSLLFDIMFFSGTGFAIAGTSLLIAYVVKKKRHAASTSAFRIRQNASGQAINLMPSFFAENGVWTGGLSGQF
ncbi:MAG: tetratricopeptide repeat protein [Deltaproteobacteria bacterium]|nr:tetratricopeptide repeat protein [Deltaproteobacteria bacterium]